MKTLLLKNSKLHIFLFLLIAAVFTFSSCKKSSDTATNDVTSATDQANFSEALNDAGDDAANVAGNNHATGKTGGLNSYAAPCNATIDSSQDSLGIIKITFNGTACNSNISRTGVVTITLQGYPSVHWRDAGAVLSLSFDNLKFTNGAGNSVTLNGTYYLTNVSGGLASDVLAGTNAGPVIHKHTATGLNVTFDNGSARTWSVYRKRTFTNTGGVTTITVSSDTTGNIATWGTNRFGETFTNSITTPIVSNSTCGFFKPISGEHHHEILRRSVDILYGVDNSGTPETGGNCAWGYQITYTGANGRSATQLVSYPF